MSFQVLNKALHCVQQLSTDYFMLGLVAIGESVGVTLLAPRKKITVMLMGNHSAGKSSFVNWYVIILNNSMALSYIGLS